MISGRHIHRAATRLSILALVCVAPTLEARGSSLVPEGDAAQDRPPIPTGPPPPELNRSRRLLHPGEPLDIVGVEEGDNSFRERVPSLLNADTSGGRVNRDELRQARLKLYAPRDDRSGRLVEVRSPSSTGRANRQAASSAQRAYAVGESEEPGWVSRIFSYLMWGIGLAGALAYALRGRTG